MRAFVLAQMALDDNDKELAIQYLQTALATLPYYYRPMYQKIERELADLGAEPFKRISTYSLAICNTMPDSLMIPPPIIEGPFSTYGFLFTEYQKDRYIHRHRRDTHRR